MYTFGCDPEIFLQHKKTGMFISAHEKAPGTKKEPFKVRDGAVQVDGLALEINIDPVTNEDDWVNNINSVLAQLRDMVDSNLEFVYKPSIVFDEKYYAYLPEGSKELGCDPDFNAWSKSIQMPPSNREGYVPNRRNAGGHLHFSDGRSVAVESGPFAKDSNPDHFEWCCEFIRYQDWSTSTECLEFDDDIFRRTVYGQAGAFRPKTYGVEHRTPSNAWLASEKLMRRIFRAAQRGVEAFEEKYSFNEARLLRNLAVG